MKKFIEDLNLKYKNKISDLQRKQKYYESTGRGGMCLSIQGKIETYFELVEINKVLIFKNSIMNEYVINLIKEKKLIINTY